jgi:PilZ domain
MKLRNLFSRRPAFSRAAVRYSCQLDGSLIMIDRMASFDGRMIDFSAGGAMFRPKLVYLMDRRDVPVCLDVGGVEVFGRIASTNPSGFGIRFDEPLDDDDIARLLRADKASNGAGVEDKASKVAEADVELF